MSKSSIRPATLQDLAAIKGIIDAVELFPSEYLDDMFSPEPNDKEPQEIWLVFDDGGPKAVAYCAPERMTNGTWNLLLIAVQPDHQGNGIGEQLMTNVENQLKTMNIRLLLVETSGTAEFTRTRKFYEKIGYENEARIREYYDTGDDKIIFSKAL